MNKKIVVLFSGGLDSTVALASAVVGYGAAAVHAVCVDYGQKHRVELTAARDILRHLNVDGDVVSVPGILHSASPLLNEEVPDQTHSVDESGVSDAFVPGRNIFLLSIAANRAVSVGAKVIYVGANADDEEGFPDCRPAFFTYATSMFQRSMDDEEFQVHPPLIHFNKRKIIEAAKRIMEHGVDVMGALALSHSCYRGQVPPCGQCSACVTRARGFADAGIPDPLLTRLAQRNSQGPEDVDEMKATLPTIEEADKQ